MTARGGWMLVVTLGSLALMTAIGAVMTHGTTAGPLSLADVMTTAAVPMFLLIAAVVAGLRRPSQPRFERRG